MQKDRQAPEAAEHLLKHADFNNEEDLQWPSQRRSHAQTASRLVRNPFIIANILLFLLSTRGFWLWWYHDRHVDTVLKESSLYCK